MGGSTPELLVSIPAEFVDQVAARVAELLEQRQASPEPWVGVDEAAVHLACSRQRIYDLVREGRLEPRRDGRRLLFRRSDLDAFLERGG